jgi:hypothetical protein
MSFPASPERTEPQPTTISPGSALRRIVGLQQARVHRRPNGFGENPQSTATMYAESFIASSWGAKTCTAHTSASSRGPPSVASGNERAGGRVRLADPLRLPPADIGKTDLNGRDLLASNPHNCGCIPARLLALVGVFYPLRPPDCSFGQSPSSCLQDRLQVHVMDFGLHHSQL